MPGCLFSCHFRQKHKSKQQNLTCIIWFLVTGWYNEKDNRVFFPDKQITLEARLWSSLEQMSIIDPLAMQSVFIVAKAKLLQWCCQTFLLTTKVLPHNAQQDIKRHPNGSMRPPQPPTPEKIPLWGSHWFLRYDHTLVKALSSWRKSLKKREKPWVDFECKKK